MEEVAFIRHALEQAEQLPSEEVDRDALWDQITGMLKRDGKIPS